LGSILPTYNHVTRLLIALRQYACFQDVCEILLRYYKPVPDRLRPVDRMVAHTGFLIFGRPVPPSQGSDGADIGDLFTEAEEDEIVEL
jgi:tRNA (adenine57-N1/adenine58-N1)-methyltransferase